MNPLDELVLEADQSIRNAMQLLDKNARGILFVIAKMKLVGVVTDGDIRRALLAGLELDANITNAMNSKFIALPISADGSLIRRTFNSRLRMIPLCDESGNLVDVADVQRSHRIPLLEPDLSGRELEYVTDCIQTNWISSQGHYVRQFEAQFERLHPGYHALAVSNGTVALHLALHALGIGEGDEIIVPNVTFAATINAVLYCNATPILCEINPKTLCIDDDEIKKCITTKTKAIIPVHLYGQPCDMDAINRIALQNNLLVIEDCAEALGSQWSNKPVGVFGDAATFSFYGNKTISTGEGGMLLFRNKMVYEQAKVLRDHGMSPEKKYWHERVGFNYRLTNLQAAIGVAQIERLEDFLRKKIHIGKLYGKLLNGVIGISSTPYNRVNTVNSYWLYTIILEKNLNRDLIIQSLLKKGIDSRPIFYPLHTMKPYKKFCKDNDFKKSIQVSQSGLSLPSSVNLKEEEIIYIVESLKNAILEQQ
jgi:perosamine synthetase